jgi:hypothetical protein
MSAIEIPVLFENRLTRVEIDQAAVMALMETTTLTRPVVDEFLRRFRTNIQLAIEAHLYAQGAPFDRHVVISLGDFNGRDPL